MYKTLHDTGLVFYVTGEYQTGEFRQATLIYKTLHDTGPVYLSLASIRLVLKAQTGYTHLQDTP